MAVGSRTHGSVVRAPAEEALGSIPCFSFSWLTNVDGHADINGVKDLWYSSRIWLLQYIIIDMNQWGEGFF